MKIIDVPYASIDLEALESLKAQIEKLFDHNEYKLLLDLTNVNYLSSTGLGLLVYINNKCTENGGSFGIFGLQEYTLDMLKLTKLDSVIKVYKDRTEVEKIFS